MIDNFDDVVRRTRDSILGMDIYKKPLEDLEQRIQEAQRGNALNKGLEQNSEQKEKATARQNSRTVKKAEKLDER